MFNLHNVYLITFWHIFSEALRMAPKWLKELKLASTKVDVLKKTLFLFWCSNLPHLCFKNAIPRAEPSFRQLRFQSLAAFYFFTTFFSRFWFKKKHFRNSKHFYGSRFNFQGINFQSTTVDSVFKTQTPNLPRWIWFPTLLWRIYE